jgi:hypothetical protein
MRQLPGPRRVRQKRTGRTGGGGWGVGRGSTANPVSLAPPLGGIGAGGARREGVACGAPRVWTRTTGVGVVPRGSYS